ncbi:MAG TPA: hypothetical protein VMV29_20465 [Ktedonobacterales bacterium]|nr:hypothetical protein [Ktedonobacterales bacterium]
MGFADEPTSGAPIEAYHRAASGAPVGADPMALIERPPVGVVTLHAPGYRPVTPPPAVGSAKRGASRGQAWRVAVVALVVALAMIGAVLAGILWR